MTPANLNTLAILLAVVGFACFAVPIVQRLRGQAPAEAPGSGKSLRSPLWWVGFVLTAAAIALQRFAQQGGG